MKRFLRKAHIMKKAASIVSVILILFLAGCSKTSDGNPGEPSGQAKPETSEIAVYLGEEMPFPDRYSINSSVLPLYRKENGSILCLTSAEKNDGEHEETEYCLVTVGAESEPLPVPIEKGEAVVGGLIQEDCLTLLTTDWSETDKKRTYALTVWRPSSGETERSGELTSFFSLADRDPFFAVSHLARDTSDRIFLASDNEIVCLDKDFVFQYSLTASDTVVGLSSDRDGQVFVCTDDGNGSRITRIDPDAKSFGGSIFLKQRIDVLTFGEDHDAYFTTDNGVWYADGLFDHSLATNQLLDYSSSRLYLASLLCVLDGDTMLFTRADNDGRRIPMLYRRAEDYDPADKTVIELAHVGSLPMWFDQKILKYNAEHPDAIIVTKDWSEFAAGGDIKEAKNKLAMELAAGTARPDILIGWPNDPFIEQTVKSGLFRDLGIYTKNDALVNDENIFVCVRRTLSDEEGRLWGLTREYQIRSVLSTKELLGKFDGQTSWTVEEFLDYVETLPSGIFLMDELSQENAARLLFGSEGYGAFIDAESGTCDFTDPVFIRYLVFLKSLPKTAEESRNLAANPLSGLSKEEQYQYYWTGGIALKNKWFHSLNEFLSLEIEFGTKDIVLIGQPTSSGKQPITVPDVCVMTSFCENGEIAWDVIRSLIDQNDFSGDWLPVLKSDFEAKAREYYNTDFIFYFDGWEASAPKDPAHPITNESLEKPGIITEFTEADAAYTRHVSRTHAQERENL